MMMVQGHAWVGVRVRMALTHDGSGCKTIVPPTPPLFGHLAFNLAVGYLALYLRRGLPHLTFSTVVACLGFTFAVDSFYPWHGLHWPSNLPRHAKRMGRRLRQEVCCLCGRDIKDSDGDRRRKREKIKLRCVLVYQLYAWHDSGSSSNSGVGGVTPKISGGGTFFWKTFL